MPKSLGLLALLLLVGCTSVRSTQKKLNSGDYDAAIEKALKELRPNKTKKSAQDYVLLLHEAFLKDQERDHRALDKVKTILNWYNVNQPINSLTPWTSVKKKSGPSSH